MEIEIDYNPTPEKFFFISISLNDKESISFDNTSKGHRVIKQVLIDKKSFLKDRKSTSEWDTLVLKNGKFIKKYHVRWINLDKKDWVNNEIWETTWEKPISKRLSDKLMKYSQFISDNYKKLGKFPKKVKEFENLLYKEIMTFN